MFYMINIPSWEALYHDLAYRTAKLLFPDTSRDSHDPGNVRSKFQGNDIGQHRHPVITGGNCCNKIRLPA